MIKGKGLPEMWNVSVTRQNGLAASWQTDSLAAAAKEIQEYGADPLRTWGQPIRVATVADAEGTRFFLITIDAAGTYHGLEALEG